MTCLFASLAGALLTLAAALIIDRTVMPREKAHLTRRFGVEDQAYRQRVRR